MNKEKLQNILSKQLGIDGSIVTESSDFVKDLGADSLDLVEIVMSVEKTFRIKIEQEEMESCNTVGATLRLIEEKQSVNQTN